uniref:Translation initiation factor eIF2 assembly protein n=1 Tax=Eptatretus burgeri TaxID=7764 RepID=A0A8C4Q4S6_EPTBU
MKKEQIVKCQFSEWYPRFKKHTIKSIVLQIPPEVIDYLHDDGTLVLPIRNDCPSRHEDETEEWSDEESSDVPTLSPPKFPEFESRVEEAIAELGGRVFPKLNWSSPKDAQWIALNSSLCCHSLHDVLLLLKSSDLIAHDLTRPFLLCSDDSPDPEIHYQLTLRKWCELIPGAEFRCFVRERRLIAISQRDHTQCYRHVHALRAEIRTSIHQFFIGLVQPRFPDDDYVFDVYRDSQGRIWLVDFNPFGDVTDTLLFSWEELTDTARLPSSDGNGEADEQDLPVFRCVTEESYLQPSVQLSYRLPRDFVDLSTGQDACKLIDFLNLSSGRQQTESSDEES